ncbi:hypothetical protein COLO4_35422 [Corchorus olitorius]|uniref:Uncharacterized protein n=1 Tax=Corchorus olitorius TaxID=93759 RepID=A0A1R3GGX6_9ROSI|nr:hypothetical protein COLO4_35422 [Corchorus olitorius]
MPKLPKKQQRHVHGSTLWLQKRSLATRKLSSAPL